MKIAVIDNYENNARETLNKVLNMKISSGILPYRINKEKQLEVFLCHAGGPYWINKDVWGIVKGEHERFDTDYKSTAIREFEEETGIKLSKNEIKHLIYLDSIQQNPNKIVHCYAIDYRDNIKVECNPSLEIEWPPKSKKTILIPEIDKGEFFTLEEAEKKIIKKQYEFIIRLYRFLKEDGKL